MPNVCSKREPKFHRLNLSLYGLHRQFRIQQPEAGQYFNTAQMELDPRSRKRQLIPLFLHTRTSIHIFKNSLSARENEKKINNFQTIYLKNGRRIIIFSELLRTPVMPIRARGVWFKLISSQRSCCSIPSLSMGR